MIATLFAMTAAAAAMQADPVNDARRAYSDCLRVYMRAQLEARTDPAQFETALGSQCTSQSAAFIAALVRRDTRSGGSRARAEEDARMTMEDMRVTTVEYYNDYFSTETMPAG
jgi:hypothetical protein